MPKFPLMSKKPIYILAIESSCDDTSAAIICNDKVLSNCVANQKIHAAYGGVVPELASRAHQQNIVPVCDDSRIVVRVRILVRSHTLFADQSCGSKYINSHLLLNYSLHDWLMNTRPYNATQCIPMKFDRLP